MKLCSVGELAEIMGVVVVTLRRLPAASLPPACCRHCAAQGYDRAEGIIGLGSG
jgi:hypothetical protein